MFRLIFFLLCILSYISAEPFRLSGVFKTGDEFVGSPAVGDAGMIYFGTDQKFYAVDSKKISFEDSKPLWTYDLAVDQNFIQNPIVDDDGIVYVGSKGGVLYAFNPKTIDSSNPCPSWTYKVGTASCRPLIIDKQKLLYVESIDGYLKVIDLKTADKQKVEPIWSYKSILCVPPPVIDPLGRVYILTVMGDLLVFDPQKMDTKDPYPIPKAKVPVIPCAPILDSQSNLYIGTNDGRLFIFDSDELIHANHFEAKPHIIYITDKDIQFSFAFMRNDKEMYFGSQNGMLQAIDIKKYIEKSAYRKYREEELYYSTDTDCKLFSQAKKIDRKYPRPIWSYNMDRYLYFPVCNTARIEKNGLIYIGTGNRLYVFDPKSLDHTKPQPLWYYQGEDTDFFIPQVDDKGNIYVGSSNGTLYAFETVKQS